MNFSSEIQVGHKRVGRGRPAYVIAEIGSNHNQDLQRAKELIDAASEAGADAAKFQSLKFDELYLSAYVQPGFREFFRQIELSEDWYPELARHCHRRNLHFLSSPTYPRAVDLLLAQEVPAFKIASAQFGVYPELVSRVAVTGRPMFMSTGIAETEDIERMLQICADAGNKNVVLLHCVSAYPADVRQANLRLLQTFRDQYGCLTGYSDHTLGNQAAMTAVALGAVVIEKHITLSRKLPGPDHHFASEPAEFREMVVGIRDVEASLGSGVRGHLTDDEKTFRNDVSLKLVATRDLPAGEWITADAVTLRRCAGGILRDLREQVLRSRVRRAVRAGTPLSWDDLDHGD